MSDPEWSGGLPWSESLGLPTWIILTCQKYSSSDRVVEDQVDREAYAFWSSLVGLN